ncbi:hypothetical protein [Rhodanobacter sp. DHG33]|uniref:hypothetical protein n=1 Tax=Rhodanobacter sp. DHG33 TaxID=2775921 RepID=UPI00177F7310|nr:hypothetical protein [Rhodanobacter sp. DHG33]MBD8899014.1 hypothetical protein [Rhodanobacter sp. DHG33]
MSKAPQAMTIADIHAVYSSKKVNAVTEDAGQFHSTKRFARDPAHTGQAPQNPKDKKRSPHR